MRLSSSQAWLQSNPAKVHFNRKCDFGTLFIIGTYGIGSHTTRISSVCIRIGCHVEPPLASALHRRTGSRGHGPLFLPYLSEMASVKGLDFFSVPAAAGL